MIHFVIGTRAQLFKMTPIMLECEKRGLEWRWIYAAQHKDTFQQTLDFFWSATCRLHSCQLEYRSKNYI